MFKSLKRRVVYGEIKVKKCLNYRIPESGTDIYRIAGGLGSDPYGFLSDADLRSLNLAISSNRQLDAALGAFVMDSAAFREDAAARRMHAACW